MTWSIFAYFEYFVYIECFELQRVHAQRHIREASMEFIHKLEMRGKA